MSAGSQPYQRCFTEVVGSHGSSRLLPEEPKVLIFPE
jgi:hypothetical protein